MFKLINRIVAFLVMFCLVFEQSGFAQVAPDMNIPAYLNGLVGADKFRPMHMRWLSYDSLTNSFDLAVEQGDDAGIKEADIKKSTTKIMEYFQIGLRLPDSMFWVNLRPDAPDQIIDPYLGRTDLGKVMLEADLQLKKDLARFTSPDTKSGKEYWNKLYARAEQVFGPSDITIPTVTRPWIVPNEIIIKEYKDGAYVYKATMKVMLEQDYLKDAPGYSFDDPRVKEINEYSSELVRQLIIPQLTREVNSSKRYSGLRQAFYSLVLSQWFKQRYATRVQAEAGTGQAAAALLQSIDSRDLSGLTSVTAWSKESYFSQYVRSFQKGEYNKQETVNGPHGMTVRQYFSGGILFKLQQNIQALGQNAPLMTILPAAEASPAPAIVSVLGDVQQYKLDFNGAALNIKVLPKAQDFQGKPAAAAKSEAESQVKDGGIAKSGIIDRLLKTDQYYLDKLGSSYSFERFAALAALRKRHSPDDLNDLLVKYISNPDNRKWRALGVQMAISEIRMLGNVKAIPALITYLTDVAPWGGFVQADNAVSALVTFKEAVPVLIKTLSDNDPYMRANAAKTLGQMKNIRAESGLIKALNDEKSIVRAEAAKALAALKIYSAADKIIVLLEDEDYNTRQAAREALTELDAFTIELQLKSYMRELKADVGSTTLSNRMRAAEALGNLGAAAKSALPEIEEILSREHKLVTEHLHYGGPIYARAAVNPFYVKLLNAIQRIRFPQPLLRLSSKDDIFEEAKAEWAALRGESSRRASDPYTLKLFRRIATPEFEQRYEWDAVPQKENPRQQAAIRLARLGSKAAPLLDALHKAVLMESDFDIHDINYPDFPRSAYESPNEVKQALRAAIETINNAVRYKNLKAESADDAFVKDLDRRIKEAVDLENSGPRYSELLAIGEPAEPALINAINSVGSDRFIRYQAVLSDIGSREAFEAIAGAIQRLSDEKLKQMALKNFKYYAGINDNAAAVYAKLKSKDGGDAQAVKTIDWKKRVQRLLMLEIASIVLTTGSMLAFFFSVFYLPQAAALVSTYFGSIAGGMTWQELDKKREDAERKRQIAEQPYSPDIKAFLADVENFSGEIDDSWVRAMLERHGLLDYGSSMKDASRAVAAEFYATHSLQLLDVQTAFNKLYAEHALQLLNQLRRDGGITSFIERHAVWMVSLLAAGGLAFPGIRKTAHEDEAFVIRTDDQEFAPELEKQSPSDQKDGGITGGEIITVPPQYRRAILRAQDHVYGYWQILEILLDMRYADPDPEIARALEAIVHKPYSPAQKLRNVHLILAHLSWFELTVKLHAANILKKYYGRNDPGKVPAFLEENFEPFSELMNQASVWSRWENIFYNYSSHRREMIASAKLMAQLYGRDYLLLHIGDFNDEAVYFIQTALWEMNAFGKPRAGTNSRKDGGSYGLSAPKLAAWSGASAIAAFGWAYWLSHSIPNALGFAAFIGILQAALYSKPVMKRMMETDDRSSMLGSMQRKDGGSREIQPLSKEHFSSPDFLNRQMEWVERKQSLSRLLKVFAGLSVAVAGTVVAGILVIPLTQLSHIVPLAIGAYFAIVVGVITYQAGRAVSEPDVLPSELVRWIQEQVRDPFVPSHISAATLSQYVSHHPKLTLQSEDRGFGHYDRVLYAYPGQGAERQISSVKFKAVMQSIENYFAAMHDVVKNDWYRQYGWKTGEMMNAYLKAQEDAYFSRGAYARTYASHLLSRRQVHTLNSDEKAEFESMRYQGKDTEPFVRNIFDRKVREIFYRADHDGQDAATGNQKDGGALQDIDRLLADLKSDNKTLRDNAIDGLSASSDPRAVTALGELLLETAEQAQNLGKSIAGASDPSTLDKMIRESVDFVEEVIKALAKTRSERASEYLLKAYNFEYPGSTFFPNGTGNMGGPGWAQSYWDVLIPAQIIKALGRTGGAQALYFLLERAQDGYPVGMGGSHFAWIPMAAIEALAMIGDKKALPFVRSRAGAPFMGDIAADAEAVITESVRQRSVTAAAEVFPTAISIFGIQVALSQDEIDYSVYDVTKLVYEAFVKKSYKTRQERMRSVVERDRLLHRVPAAQEVIYHFPEDSIYEGLMIGDKEISVIRKYIDGRKKNAGILERLGVRSSRIEAIEKDVMERLGQAGQQRDGGEQSWERTAGRIVDLAVLRSAVIGLPIAGVLSVLLPNGSEPWMQVVLAAAGFSMAFAGHAVFYSAVAAAGLLRAGEALYAFHALAKEYGVTGANVERDLTDGKKDGGWLERRIKAIENMLDILKSGEDNEQNRMFIRLLEDELVTRKKSLAERTPPRTWANGRIVEGEVYRINGNSAYYLEKFGKAHPLFEVTGTTQDALKSWYALPEHDLNPAAAIYKERVKQHGLQGDVPEEETVFYGHIYRGRQRVAAIVHIDELVWVSDDEVAAELDGGTVDKRWKGLTRELLRLNKNNGLDVITGPHRDARAQMINAITDYMVKNGLYADDLADYQLYQNRKIENYSHWIRAFGALAVLGLGIAIFYSWIPTVLASAAVFSGAMIIGASWMASQGINSIIASVSALAVLQDGAAPVRTDAQGKDGGSALQLAEQWFQGVYTLLRAYYLPETGAQDAVGHDAYKYTQVNLGAIADQIMSMPNVSAALERVKPVDEIMAINPARYYFSPVNRISYTVGSREYRYPIVVAGSALLTMQHLARTLVDLQLRDGQEVLEALIDLEREASLNGRSALSDEEFVRAWAEDVRVWLLSTIQTPRHLQETRALDSVKAKIGVLVNRGPQIVPVMQKILSEDASLNSFQRFALRKAMEVIEAQAKHDGGIIELTMDLKKNFRNMKAGEFEAAKKELGTYLRRLRDELKMKNVNLEQYATINEVLKGLQDDRTTALANEKTFGVVTKLKGQMTDVLDDAGNIVAQTEIGIAHIFGLRHRTVNAFVFGPNNELVLQRRVHNAAEAKSLTIFGGHLAAGQTYDSTLRRELMQELGLSAIERQLGGMVYPIGTEGQFQSDTQNKDDRFSNNNEVRSLYVYILTQKEFDHIRSRRNHINGIRRDKTYEEFERWIENEQGAGTGYGEVWNYVITSFDSLKKAREEGRNALRIEETYKDRMESVRVPFSADLLAPLVNGTARATLEPIDPMSEIQELLDLVRTADQDVLLARMRGQKPAIKQTVADRVKGRFASVKEWLRSDTAQKDGGNDIVEVQDRNQAVRVAYALRALAHRARNEIDTEVDNNIVSLYQKIGSDLRAVALGHERTVVSYADGKDRKLLISTYTQKNGSGPTDFKVNNTGDWKIHLLKDTNDILLTSPAGKFRILTTTASKYRVWVKFEAPPDPKPADLNAQGQKTEPAPVGADRAAVDRGAVLMQQIRKLDATVSDGGNEQPATVGGVDFRAIPAVVVPAVGTGAGVAGAVAAVVDVQELDRQWNALQRKVADGQMPYNDLRAYISACCANREACERLMKVSQWVAEVLKIEEDACVQTSAQMKELIALL